MCFLGARGLNTGGGTVLPYGRLRSETGKDFQNFGLESGMVFEGTTGMHESICRFSSK